MVGDERPRQQVVGAASQPLHRAVHGSGKRSDVILAQPRRRKRNEREPEQQVRIGPQDPAGGATGRVQQMVVIVPVDPQEDEALQVAEELRNERDDHLQFGRIRGLQLQHHDGNDDGDDAIAECFQSGFGHII